MRSTFYRLKVKKVWFAPLVFLLLLVDSLQARSIPVDTLKAYTLFQKADSLQKHAEYDSSSHYFEQASILYEQSQARKRAIDCQLNLAGNQIESGSYGQAGASIADVEKLIKHHLPDSDIYKARLIRLRGRLAVSHSKYDEAMKLYSKGLELLSDQQEDAQKLRASLTYYIGDLHDTRGAYDKAMDHFFRALDIHNRTDDPNRLFLSSVYNSIGITYRNLGESAKGLKYLEKGLAIDKQELGTNHPNVASGLNNIAIHYYYKGDYKRALEYMKQATSILATYFGKNHPKVAVGYNNISIVHSEIGELEKAIEYMKKSIAIKKKMIGEVNKDVAIGYQNLGALHFDLKQYEKAIREYRKALEIHQRVFDGPHPEIANVYANMGQLYMKQQNYEKALEYLNKDLDINTRLLGQNHPFIGDTHTKIGEAYHSKKEQRPALQHYRKAVAVLTGESINEMGIANLALENVTHPVLLMEAFEGKGEAHRAMFEETGDNAHLEQALDTYLKASSLIRKMQVEYRNDESKLLLKERADKLYRAGLETAYTLYKQTGDERQIRYALYFTEQGKARVLLEQLMETNAENFAGLPDSLVSKENKIRRNITSLNRTIKEKTGSQVHIDSVKLGGLKDSLFTLKRKLTSHIKRLEQNYPKYYRLKFEDTQITPEHIQKELLEPEQTIIEYSLEDESLFAFLINRKQVRLKKIELDTTLASVIRDFRTATVEENSSEFARLSHLLYRNLFEPLLPNIQGSSLKIVPDGILNYLPFEALVTRHPTPTETFSDFSYLIQKYTISYAPSASLLKHWNRQHESSSSNSSFIAFAPVFPSADATGSSVRQERFYPPVSPLPLSRYETQQVDSVISRRGYQSDIFMNRKASETAFKKTALSEYSIIHLATHALMVEDSVAEPGIYFANEPNSPDDGILHLEEVYNLNLNANLVVLSACETGLGEVVQGEGVLSLARAFQYAGARNLFVSLWKVDDRSTSELMVQFYKYLSGEEAIRRAARQAKLHLLGDPRYASPRFWAPFILLGN